MTAVGTAARRAVVSWLRSGADAYDIEMLESDRNAARKRASHWHREVGQLLDVEAQDTTDGLLARLRQVLADGVKAQAATDDALEVCGSHELARADAEDQRDEARAERDAALEEITRTRAVLAPDVSTAGTPLHEVATAALATARATAVAAEPRWWVAPGNASGVDRVSRYDLRKRAEQLDPSGATPDGDQPPTPSIFRADDEPRVPRRAAAGLAANLTAAAVRIAQQRDQAAGHHDEVLDALRVADRARDVPGPRSDADRAVQVLARAVRAYGEQADDVVDATIGCGERVGGRVCSLPEDHEGEHVPSWTVLDDEQVAREAMHAAITAPPLGWASSAAADVIDRLARAGFVPGIYPPGMAIDGDMLRSLITDALPRWATDEFAGELADAVLDAAVRAGFTILHGPTLMPRPTDVPQVLAGPEEPGLSELTTGGPGRELFDAVRGRVGAELVDHRGREGRAVRHVMAALHDVLREGETAAQR